jgi:hypothetical protein
LSILQQSPGLVKDVKHRFTTHKNVIIGSELVTFLVSARICTTRLDAVDLCQNLVLDDILQHEYQEHAFKDKYLFYLISPKAAQVAANLCNDSDESDPDSPFVEQLESAINMQGASTGHSALARSLMRKMSTIPQDDYLNDVALQDDRVAQAAADRCCGFTNRFAHALCFLFQTVMLAMRLADILQILE